MGTLPTHGSPLSRQPFVKSSIQTPDLWIALIWMFGFFLWFQSFQLPENHIDRWALWPGLPYRLLDLIDPPATPNAPWSWFYLGQRVPFLFIALATWIGCGTLGSLILRSLKIESRGAERLCFSVGIGLSVFSLVMLLLGRSGWMSRWPLVAVLAASAVGELICRRRKTPGGDSAITSAVRSMPRRGSSMIGWVLLAVLGLFVFGQQLGAMSPQTDFDVLEYHLGGPKEWFQLGRIQRLPHNVYTSFPFLSEMLILSSMVLYGDWDWGALAGQSVIAGFIPLTAIGLYAAGRRWFSENTGRLAALVYLTSPWMYRISIIAYAEGGLSFYLFASIFAAFRYGFPTPEPAPTDVRTNLSWVFLSGLLAGSAMACKYTGLVLVVIPIGLMLVWMAVRRLSAGKVQQAAMVVALYGVGVACTIGPWLLKNVVETGNPVFPLAVRIFGGADRDEVLDTKWRHGHDSDYANLIVGLIDLPVKLRDVTATNDWHTPLLFALAPLVAALRLATTECEYRGFITSHQSIDHPTRLVLCRMAICQLVVADAPYRPLLCAHVFWHFATRWNWCPLVGFARSSP